MRGYWSQERLRCVRCRIRIGASCLLTWIPVPQTRLAARDYLRNNAQLPRTVERQSYLSSLLQVPSPRIFDSARTFASAFAFNLVSGRDFQLSCPALADFRLPVRTEALISKHSPPTRRPYPLRLFRIMAIDCLSTDFEFSTSTTGTHTDIRAHLTVHTHYYD